MSILRCADRIGAGLWILIHGYSPGTPPLGYESAHGAGYSIYSTVYPGTPHPLLFNLHS